MSAPQRPRFDGPAASPKIGKLKRFLFKLEDNPVKVAQQITAYGFALYLAVLALRLFGKDTKAIAEAWVLANTSLTLLVGFCLGYLTGRSKGVSRP